MPFERLQFSSLFCNPNGCQFRLNENAHQRFGIWSHFKCFAARSPLRRRSPERASPQLSLTWASHLLAVCAASAGGEVTSRACQPVPLVVRWSPKYRFIWRQKAPTCRLTGTRMVKLSVLFPGLKDGTWNKKLTASSVLAGNEDLAWARFWIGMGKRAQRSEMGPGGWKLAFAIQSQSSMTWTLPEAVSVDVKWQRVNIRANSPDKDKKLSGVRGVGGHCISAGAGTWKPFWGRWRWLLERMLESHSSC